MASAAGATAATVVAVFATVVVVFAGGLFPVSASWDFIVSNLATLSNVSSRHSLNNKDIRSSS